MQVVADTPQGRSAAHILEFSRTGGIISLPYDLLEGQVFRIEVNVDKTFENLFHAPDLLVLEATVRRGHIEDGSFGAEHVAFAFGQDFIARYWPWLDALAPHHGMRPVPPSMAPPRP